MENVLNFINNLNINKESKIIIACSGGPDSMLLLDLLNSLGYSCVCAHVNHNVREASKDEYIFLENYCKDNNIIFEGTTITKYKNDKFSEEEAREFRYDYFYDLVKKYNSKYLFTAHHGDDLTETILMRLVRGSSLKGYRGFDIITDKGDYQIIRPLVFLDKNYIEECLKVKNIEYVVDESNYLDEHTRNRYRHHVLPFLKNEDENVHLKFLKYSKKMGECISYLDRLLDTYKDTVYGENFININEFNKQDDFIKRLIVERVLDYNYERNLYLVSDIHVDNIIDLINSKKDSSDLDLPDKLHVRKEYNKVLFYRCDENEDYEYELKDIVNIYNGVIKMAEDDNDTSNYTIRINSAQIKLPLFVRNRRQGDKISIKNMNGSKKVNDVFIDCKIGKLDRNMYPIVVDSDNTVIWIPGLKKSNLDNTNKEKYDIIIKYEKRRKND